MALLTRRDFLVSVVALSGTVVATAAHLDLPMRLDPTKTASAVGPLPDVIVTAITIPSGITAGQLVTFGVTVKNQGAAATPAGKEIGVGFLVDGREVGWSGTDYRALPAGASITLHADGGSATGAGTWEATAGTHTVSAVANDVHRFGEVSWSNNASSATFTVGPAVTRPVNVAPPVISGNAVVGAVLTASEGTWS